MMYFCPCSCNDPIDPETEETTIIHLPRNLSYVQDSYLDRYSVSARFVHNPKIDQNIQHEQSLELRSDVEDDTAGLLSVIKAQDFPVRSTTHFDTEEKHSFSSYSYYSGSLSTTRGPESPLKALDITSTDWTKNTGSTTSSPSPGPSFSPSSALSPATRAASKLSALLQSPPNECMDSARDIGSSVDGETVNLTTEAVTQENISKLVCPEGLGQEIDRGEDLNKEPQGDLLISNDEVGVEASTDSGEAEADNTDLSVIEGSNMDTMSETTLCADFDNGGPQGNAEVELQPEEPIYKLYGVGGKTPFPNIDKEEENTDVQNTVSYESPDSDGFSEEGVFVNMDDLDSNNENEKSATVSDRSDDTCVSADSMFLSPEEGEFEEENIREPARKMSLQEAISRAASDLSKMSLEKYGQSDSSGVAQTEDSSDKMDTGEEGTRSPVTLATVGRGSSLRGSSGGLKIQIVDHSGPEDQKQFPATSSTLSDSPLYPENEFNFSRVELRKSSSLKTNKTPPGTPHRKKVVRFADAMGLDLESVRHVLNMESPPKIPASAMADLREGLNEDRREIGSKYLCPCFNQPGASDTFYQKVMTQKVCLENAIITDLTITGFVRVNNISFHKTCRVRYTHNGWATFHDIAASYVQNSCDGPTDRFSFSIVAPAYFVPGCKLEFAVSLNASGVEYWDNNDGKNYVFECFAKTVPTENETAWMHFL